VSSLPHTGDATVPDAVDVELVDAFEAPSGQRPAAPRSEIGVGFVPPPRQLSDTELVRLRHLASEGWSDVDLGAAFDISAAYAGRLVRGLQRGETG